MHIRHRTSLATAFLLAALAACTQESGVLEGGPSDDAASQGDALHRRHRNTIDAGSSSTDAGTSSTDAGASTPDAGATTTDAGGTTPGASLAACPPASGATRYVSTTGNDANLGTAASPLRTIQRAADLANPGDVVHVLPGTYTGGSATMPLGYIRRSGTSSAPLVFCSEQPGAAKIDGQNTVSTGFYLEGSYVKVLGFDISRFTGGGVSVYGSNGTVVGNNIHDIGRVCSDSEYGKDGIFTTSTNVTIAGNVIHTIGRLSAGEQGCAPATAYYQNHDHGIYVESTTNISITNNVFYDNKHGWAIHVYSSSGPGTSGLTIVNNTFAFPNPYRDGHILLAQPAVSNATIANNVFYQPQTEGVRFSSATFSNVSVRNNLTTSAVTTATNPGGTVVVSGNYDNTNALLASPTSFDFHLTSTSPAIDRGLSFPDVKTDIEGVPRPQGAGFDIGAYERR